MIINHTTETTSKPLILIISTTPFVLLAGIRLVEMYIVDYAVEVAADAYWGSIVVDDGGFGSLLVDQSALGGDGVGDARGCWSVGVEQVGDVLGGRGD